MYTYQTRGEKKLDDKSIMCVLIGVSSESKACKLFTLIMQQVVTSRDVIFEEDKGWNWDKETRESSKEELIWEEEAEPDTGNDVVEAPQTIQNVLLPEGVQRVNEVPVSEGVLRVRKPPIYLQDYATGDFSEEEEDTNNLVMFACLDDPVSFE